MHGHGRHNWLGRMLQTRNMLKRAQPNCSKGVNMIISANLLDRIQEMINSNLQLNIRLFDFISILESRTIKKGISNLPPYIAHYKVLSNESLWFVWKLVGMSFIALSNACISYREHITHQYCTPYTPISHIKYVYL